jgi:hypothetical protein
MTHIARECTLPTMYDLMYLQSTFQFVHFDVSSEHSSHLRIYYTNDRKIGAPLYVHVYVPLDHPADRMTYYTHRKKMDAPQYVLFDVSSKHVSV